MFGGVADQRIDGLDLVRKVLVVGCLAAAVRAASGLAILVIHIYEVDVAGDIELARAQLAHADHPQAGAAGGLAAIACARQQRRAVQGVEFLLRAVHGDIQRQFGQLGHGTGDHAQRRLRWCLAVQHHQALEHDLP